MSLDTYIDMRHNAPMIQDTGGYAIGSGEANPRIFRDFVEHIIKPLPRVIWEPFAGHTRTSDIHEYVDGSDLRVISFDVEPVDSRVIYADSTSQGPREYVGGVFFHPPYFGTVQFSKDDGEISRLKDWDSYVDALEKTVCIIKECVVDGGFVCAVGRNYRHGVKRVRLDLEYVRMFESSGFTIHSFMISIPDVVIIFKKGSKV